MTVVPNGDETTNLPPLDIDEEMQRLADDGVSGNMALRQADDEAHAARPPVVQQEDQQFRVDQDDFEVADHVSTALMAQDLIINSNAAVLDQLRSKRSQYKERIKALQLLDEAAARTEQTLVDIIVAAENARALLDSRSRKAGY